MSRKIMWGRRLLVATTLALGSLLMTAGAALAVLPDKYMW